VLLDRSTLPAREAIQPAQKRVGALQVCGGKTLAKPHGPFAEWTHRDASDWLAVVVI